MTTHGAVRTGQEVAIGDTGEPLNRGPWCSLGLHYVQGTSVWRWTGVWWAMPAALLPSEW